MLHTVTVSVGFSPPGFLVGAPLYVNENPLAPWTVVVGHCRRQKFRGKSLVFVWPIGILVGAMGNPCTIRSLLLGLPGLSTLLLRR